MTEIERLIDHSLYPRAALAEARQAYRDYCTFKVTPLEDGKARIVVSVMPAHEGNARDVVLSFLNFALDKAAEVHTSDE